VTRRRLWEIASAAVLALVLAAVAGGAVYVKALNDGLARALQTGDDAVIRRQIRRGAWVDTANQDGKTALLRAAFTGDTGFCGELLRRGANPNRANRAGEAPLLAAAVWGRTGLVAELLRRGADPRARDWSGRSAISLAAEHGFLEVVRLLREAGASAVALPPPRVARDSVLRCLGGADSMFRGRTVVVTFLRLPPGSAGSYAVELSRPHPHAAGANRGRPVRWWMSLPAVGPGPIYADGRADEPAAPQDGVDEARRRAAVIAACKHAFDRRWIGSEFEVRVTPRSDDYEVELARIPYEPSARWRVRVSSRFQVIRAETERRSDPSPRHDPR
jgi:ankyrin repeat protein